MIRSLFFYSRRNPLISSNFFSNSSPKAPKLAFPKTMPPSPKKLQRLLEKVKVHQTSLAHYKNTEHHRHEDTLHQHFLELSAQNYLESNKKHALAENEYIRQFKTAFEKDLELYAEELYQFATDKSLPAEMQSIYYPQFMAISSHLNNGIENLFIANRSWGSGLVIEAAKKLGFKPIVPYIPIDALTTPVLSVPEDQRIPRNNYTSEEETLSLIIKSGKPTAVHPLWGYHSESKQFADDCKINNIVFIGPSKLLEILSNKAKAKQWCNNLDVPVPNTFSSNTHDIDSICKSISEENYPIMLKAEVGGGGGRGTARANNEDELRQIIQRFRRILRNEHVNIMAEEFIEEAEQIEAQYVGDKLVGFRNCSLQIDDTKGLERSETRKAIIKRLLEYTDNISAELKKLGSRGLLTFEFLITQKGNNTKIYFNECNARTQVEHKVTEMTLGVDLIEWGIRDVMGRTYDHELERRLGENFDEAIRTRLLNQPPVLQFRILGCEVNRKSMAEAELVFSGLTGKVTKLKLPDTDDNCKIILGVQEGTELDLSQNLEPQIGLGIIKGTSWDEVYGRAIQLTQAIEIEIDNKPTRLNLDFLAHTLGSLLKTKTTEKTSTWPKIAAEYANLLLEPVPIKEEARQERTVFRSR